MYNTDMINKKISDLIRVNYHLTINQHDRLKKLAGVTGITVASHIRQAVNDYLKKTKI
jgi:predicted DNA-binding protein